MSSMSISRKLENSVLAILTIQRQNVRMTSRGDEVQQSVNSVIPETRVTLDARLLSKDVIILTFEVTNNFLESATRMRKEPGVWVKGMYANSLSMLSPKPGVSTIVRAIRTPSSSSSGSSQETRKTERMKKYVPILTGLIRIPSST